MRWAFVLSTMLVGCGEPWPIVVGGEHDDQVLALARDDNGFVATGFLNRSVTTGSDLFVRRYGFDAAQDWSLRTAHRNRDGNEGGAVMGRTVAVASDGSFVVGLEFHGRLELTGSPVAPVTSVDEPSFETPGGDVALLGVSPSGDAEWVLAFGGEGLDDAVVVAPGSEGSFAVAARFHREINIGGETLLAADGPGSMDGYAGDVFVARYDASRAHLWSLSGGGIGGDTPADLLCDSSDDVVVVGVFARTASFGGPDLVSGGGGDIFIAKYRGTDGGHIWSRSFGGPASDGALAVALHEDGRIVVGGYTEGGVDFGGGNLTTAGGRDGFVATFDADGNHVWSTLIGGSGRDTVSGLSVSAGTVIAAGAFEGTLNDSVVANGGEDALIAWLTAASGEVEAILSLGGSETDGAADVVVDDDHVLVGGHFEGAADLGGSAESNGEHDGFVARLARP